MTLPFSLKAGEENYFCLRQHVSDTLFVDGFEPWAGQGMHHVSLLIDNGSAPDGLTTCKPTLRDTDILFSAGAGAPALTLPPGVATRIPAGSQLMFQVHVFNASDAPLAGMAGQRLYTAAESTVVHEAGLLYAGPTGFLVQQGHDTVTGRCTLKAAATLVAIGPHMHALGVHEKVWIDDDDDEPLLDEPFDPDHQEWRPVHAELQAGDVIRVACTYDNGTGTQVRFGPTADEEMCYARLLLYPPAGESFCVR